jgi:hypothetical protein
VAGAASEGISVLQHPVLSLDEGNVRVCICSTRQPVLPRNEAVLQKSAAPVSVCSTAACAIPYSSFSYILLIVFKVAASSVTVTVKAFLRNHFYTSSEGL